MSTLHLVIRSLRYYWRTGAVIALGVAVAAAVIVGSLCVGDSVKGSLHDTALARLGTIDSALVAPRFFRRALTDDLKRRPELAKSVRRIVPIISIRGSAESMESEAVLPNVQVLGVDDSFWRLYSDTKLHLNGRSAAVCKSLARDLGLKVGDSVLVNIDRQGAISSDTLFARRSRKDTLTSMRLRIIAILPDTGVGGFRLGAESGFSRNVFVSQDWLASSIDKRGKANSLLIEPKKNATDIAREVQSVLGSACGLADYGLKLVRHPERNYISLESDALLLSNSQLHAAEVAAHALGSRTALASIYLATTIRKVDAANDIPYSIVAAAGSFAPYASRAAGATYTACPAQDEILLNSWAAQDLNARVGDNIELAYLISHPDGSYSERRMRFRLSGVVGMDDPLVDQGLVPTFEGITDTASIDEWHAPFPVDLDRIRKKDEDYWNAYRATPKAFVSLGSLKSMWKNSSSEHSEGYVTSLRMRPKPGEVLDVFERQFADDLARRFSPQSAGMVFRPVKKIALASSQGSTDFAGLFLGLSFFIVVAGAALAGMLMRLSAERRAAEVGVLLACGLNLRRAGVVVFYEELCLTLIGVVVGLPLGILYAWGIITALASWWQGAVNAQTLWLHLNMGSVVIGAVSGFGIGVFAMIWALHGLVRKRVPDLLHGWQAMDCAVSNAVRRRNKSTLVLLLIVSVVLIGLAAAGVVSVQWAFFTAGFLLLVIGLICADYALLGVLSVSAETPTIMWLAIRSAAANRARSLLVAGLLAAASFIMVAVAANTRDFSRVDFTRRDSGTGGFALRAISSTPIRYDFGTASGRENLGFPPEDESLFAGVKVISFLMSPGEDISCLNMAKPSQPRVLGVSGGMIKRGGFDVVTGGLSNANAWNVLLSRGVCPVFGDADSVMWTLHSGLGKACLLPAEDGKSINAQFAGLVRGSIFASELLISEDRFRRLYPSVDTPRYFLIDAPADRADAVARSLRRNLGDLGLEVQSTREVLNDYMSVQNTYLSVFLALGGLGLLLGTVGLIVVLLRSALERRGEFALLAATGMARNTIAKMLVIENAVLLVAGLCIGTLSALIAVSPHLLSANARVSWLSIAGVLMSIVGVGIVSCAVAAAKVTGSELIPALRDE